MAYVNYVTKNLAIKIVYYGPGLSGKTTNLRYIYYKLDPAYRGDLICLETDTERTIFFDLLPIKAGLIGEFKVHFQLLTVPGQVFYEASRKSVLRGADGVIFVADSQVPLLDANLESFDSLRRNLLANDMDLNLMPLVFQYNKRDLENLIPVETFNNLLNPQRLPFVESSAINGWGVFESLHEIAKLSVPRVREKVLEEKKLEPEEKDEQEKALEKEIYGKLQTPRLEEKLPEARPAIPAESKRKVRTHEDIERELERLAKEFLGKKGE